MQYIYKIVIDNLALESVVFQFYFEIIKRDGLCYLIRQVIP